MLLKFTIIHNNNTVFYDAKVCINNKPFQTFSYFFFLIDTKLNI